MAKRIIIAGGGTGGHIFPAIAIANALKKEDNAIEILFVGARGKMEMEKVPQAGYRIEGLEIAGFNRSSLIKNISLPLKLIKSFWQVRKIMASFKPDGVVGVGGYSTFPVLRYAQAKGIPTFIHESNSFAGKANIMLGKKATRIFVAADGMQKFFPPQNIEISGNPVRPEILNSTSISKEEALSFFGLSPDRPVVLVIGGSLGAKAVNEAVDKGLEQMVQKGLQLIWQTGKPYAVKARQSAQGQPGVWVNDFITRMDYAYAAADLVISRSGAMSVAELCVAEKPVIFVPYPFAAEDHQTVNALHLVEKNAALMVTDKEAANQLVPTLIELAGNEQKQFELKKNIKMHAVRHADEQIAQQILRYLK